MCDKKISKTRETIVETVSWILRPNDDDRKKIKDFILEHGMRSFLLCHGEIGLNDSEHEKIEVLKRVIENYDGAIESIDFQDVDDFS